MLQLIFWWALLTLASSLRCSMLSRDILRNSDMHGLLLLEVLSVGDIMTIMICSRASFSPSQNEEKMSRKYSI